MVLILVAGRCMQLLAGLWLLPLLPLRLLCLPLRLLLLQLLLRVLLAEGGQHAERAGHHAAQQRSCWAPAAALAAAFVAAATVVVATASAKAVGVECSGGSGGEGVECVWGGEREGVCRVVVVTVDDVLVVGCAVPPLFLGCLLQRVWL